MLVNSLLNFLRVNDDSWVSFRAIAQLDTWKELKESSPPESLLHDAFHDLSKKE